MVDHPGVEPEAAAPEGRPGGQAGGIGGIDVVKPHAPGCQRVDIRAGVPVVAVAAQVVGAQAVNVDVEDAHVVLQVG